MRVGVFLDLGLPTAGGGYRFQEDVFAAFLSAAAESRHSFVVFCMPPLAASLAGRLPPNVETYPFSETESSALRLLRRVPLVRRFLPPPHSLDWHATMAGIEFMWFVGAPGRVLDIPYVTVVWDLQHRSHPWFPEVSAAGQWIHRELLFQKVLRRAAAVIVGTEVGKAEVHSFFQVPSERILILPHPTPEFALHASGNPVDIEAKYGLSAPFVLYPAQFWAHKNHVNLLLAIAHLRDRFGLRLKVALVGSDQGNRGHIETWVRRLELNEHVRMLGFIPQPDLVQLYRSCLALTYVSFCGPENLPPLEAFAIGCPVIAADTPGAREQLAEAAILVSPADPEAIAAAIKQVAEDTSMRQDLLGRGRERAMRFRSADFVRGVFGLLDRFETVRRSWAA
jgi:glycosyltransferase involved in cell wall biosynthesis